MNLRHFADFAFAVQGHHGFGQFNRRQFRLRIADVESLSVRYFVVKHEVDGLDQIADVAPCAHIRALAMDLKRLSAHEPAREVADRALAGLARSVDIERPHRGRADAMGFAVAEHRVFPGELADRVDPAPVGDRAAGGRRRLDDGVGARAVDLAGGKIDDARNPGFNQAVEQIEGAEDIDLQGRQRALIVVRDPGDRRAMDDGRSAVDSRPQAMPVEHVTFDDLDVRRLCQMRHETKRVAREAVEQPDPEP
jgi:hypothetical protein